MEPVKSIIYFALSKVPAKIKALSGVTRSRMTIYNWAHTGRIDQQGTIRKLQTVTRCGQIYTTEEWLTEFMRNMG
jgi:cbb3-type cytochrome oxidase cytochrome c subunit